MKLTLDNQCTLTGAGPEIINKIRQALTMKNPAYIEAKKHKRWTGNMDKVLYFCSKEPVVYGPAPSISFPRGFLRRALDIIGKIFAFQDDRRTFPPLNLEFIGRLRAYQDEALTTILKKDFGVLDALMGSGKTVIALAVIVARRQPTLILVHNKELLYQWRDRIAKFLGVVAGLIGDGKFDIQPITVAIINSAKKHLDDLPDHFGQIVVDECHRTPAAMFSEVVQAFDCKYMLGLSATPYRRDGLTNLIHWFIGDLVHQIDPKELQDSGAVLIPEIRTRETGFNYQKLLSLIVVDGDRNNLIVRDILFEVRHHPGTVLVVSDRIEHCQTLQKILKKKPGLRVEILAGKLTKGKERTSLVEDIRAGKIKVVIATVQLIGEGVDFPCLTSLFLATPIKFSARLIQVIGRILRPADGKQQPRVYDYQDPVGPLFASAKARQKTYRDMEWIK